MRLILSGTGAILLDFWPEIGATPRLYLATRLFEPFSYISKSHSSNLLGYIYKDHSSNLTAIFRGQTVRT